MELRQLRYFVKVAETLNFSEAARAMCVTQSTLSQQIKQLEDELGEQLLMRSSHNVALTEAGKTILESAKSAIYDAELCKERINDLNRLSTGTLNIGVTYSFSPILTETISTFMKSYPKIKLNVLYKPMGELMEALKERTVDFVLAFKPSKEIEGIESHILFQNYLSAVVGKGHPLAGMKRVSLQELERYDLALPSKGLQARNALEELVTPYTKLNIKIELNEVNILLELLRNSNMVSILAEATTHNKREVVAIPIDVPNNEMSGCVHVLKDAYRKKSMMEFIKMLGDSLAVKERQNAWI